MISVPLASYLGLLGHECRVIEGLVDEAEPHVWLELPDGRIIDPTADQFSKPRRRMPKVFIGAKPKWYRVIAHDIVLKVKKSYALEAARRGLQIRDAKGARKH